jgi:hypothetical protein
VPLHVERAPHTVDGVLKPRQDGVADGLYHDAVLHLDNRDQLIEAPLHHRQAGNVAVQLVETARADDVDEKDRDCLLQARHFGVEPQTFAQQVGYIGFDGFGHRRASRDPSFTPSYSGFGSRFTEERAGTVLGDASVSFSGACPSEPDCAISNAAVPRTVTPLSPTANFRRVGTSSAK